MRTPPPGRVATPAAAHVFCCSKVPEVLSLSFSSRSASSSGATFVRPRTLQNSNQLRARQRVQIWFETPSPSRGLGVVRDPQREQGAVAAEFKPCILWRDRAM